MNVAITRTLDIFAIFAAVAFIGVLVFGAI